MTKAGIRDRPRFSVLRLHIELEDVSPPIWRLIEISEQWALEGLHRVLQVLVGWHDSHLWMFTDGERRWMLPDPDRDDPVPPLHAAKAQLAELLGTTGARLHYVYDFGDDWRIAIECRDRSAADPGVCYPRCLEGARAGPLEDSGGPPGYEELILARSRKRSPRARELLRWAGKGWDPEAFDLGVMNKALSGLPAPRAFH